MIAQFVFNEVSPAAASTNAASSQAVSGTAGSPAGVASSQMMDDGAGVDIVAELAGASGGTLDIFIQASPDGGTTWVDIVHFAQLASGAAAVVYKTNISNLPQPASAAPVVVGTGLHSGSTGLAAGTTVQGYGFDRLRLMMASGSGTTAGAAVKVFATVQRPRVQ
jgi:hypothetical protein